MTHRFQRSRWSDTRKSIHDLPLNSHLNLPATEYFNAKASVERLNDAYGTTKWRITGGRNFPKVIRISS